MLYSIYCYIAEHFFFNKLRKKYSISKINCPHLERIRIIHNKNNLFLKTMKRKMKMTMMIAMKIIHTLTRTKKTEWIWNEIMKILYICRSEKWNNKYIFAWQKTDCTFIIWSKMSNILFNIWYIYQNNYYHNYMDLLWKQINKIVHIKSTRKQL